MGKCMKRAGARRVAAVLDALEGRLLFSNSYPYASAVDNSIVYAANGNVYTAWYEQGSGGGVLKAAKRTNSGWSDLGQVPLPSGITSSDFGEYVSIAADGNSNPAVVFADSTNGDLDFARYNGSSWVNATQIESSAAIYPSLQWNSNSGVWGVSYYYNNTHKDLRFASIDTSGSTSVVSKADLDTTGDVGRSGNLQIDPNTHNFDVAYEYTDPTGVASQVRYIAQNSSGVWGSVQTIDPDTDQGGGYISMAFDQNNGNRPAVSYYIAAVSGSSRYGLMFARMNSSGSWETGASLRSAKSIYTTLMWDSSSSRFNIVYDDDSTSTVSRFYGNYGSWSARKIVYSGGGRFVHAAATSGSDYVSTFVETGQNYMYVNDTHQLSSMAELTQGTPAYPGRVSAGTVTFNGKIYVLGGDNTSHTHTNSVIYTSNGTSWTTATTGTVFSARSGLGAVVATVGGQQRMYVIGGSTNSGSVSDVWYSTDGVNWTEATAGQDPALRFTPRSDMGVAYFNNELWVIGGTDASGSVNDAWYSSDGGVTWTNASAGSSSLYTPRSDMAVFTQSNQSTPRMYLVAGVDNDYTTGYAITQDDVWSSSDGVNWTQETSAAAFSARSGAAAVYAEGKMWILGGNYIGNACYTDVWWSIDGKNWTQTTSSLGTGRSLAGAGVISNKMFAFGGGSLSGLVQTDVLDGSLD